MWSSNSSNQTAQHLFFCLLACPDFYFNQFKLEVYLFPLDDESISSPMTFGPKMVINKLNDGSDDVNVMFKDKTAPTANMSKSQAIDTVFNTLRNHIERLTK